jgi:hypothetical protein
VATVVLKLAVESRRITDEDIEIISIAAFVIHEGMKLIKIPFSSLLQSDHSPTID